MTKIIIVGALIYLWHMGTIDIKYQEFQPVGEYQIAELEKMTLRELKAVKRATDG